MEPTNSTAPPFDGKVHLLPDAAGQPKKRFTGKHLAHVSTGLQRNLPRWLTLDLYLKPDKTYILHRIGYSVVYHKLRGECEGGEELSYAELFETVEDGEACPKCRPATFASIKEMLDGGLGKDGRVRLEHNYYKVIEIPDVPSIVSELEFVPKNSAKKEKVISRPGQELLLRASKHDDAIAALFDVIQDI